MLFAMLKINALSTASNVNRKKYIDIARLIEHAFWGAGPIMDEILNPTCRLQPILNNNILDNELDEANEDNAE